MALDSSTNSSDIPFDIFRGSRLNNGVIPDILELRVIFYHL